MGIEKVTASVEQRNPFEVEKDWLQGILISEGQSHLNFFGQEFDLSKFE